jgi:CHAT domain-containing protein/tetratricopeptide (TPR) repeat protein
LLVSVFALICTGTALSQTWNGIITKADSLFELKQFDTALEYAKKAAAYAEKKEGKKSKPYANSVNLIGNIYFAKGQYYKAVYYFTLEKDAKKAAYGIDSPNYAKALNNLSSVLSQLGRNREAEPILREALELKIRTLGENDTSVANSAHNLGAVCFNLGKYNDAEQYYRLALKIRKEYEKQNPLRYALTLSNLGSLYKVLGNYSKAEEYLMRAYEIFSKQLGQDDSRTLKALSELAMTYLATGKIAKAKYLLEEHNSIIKEIKGENHPDYYSSMYNIAMYYWSAEQYSKAMELLEKIMKGVGEKMGNGHPLYASCLNSIGLIYWQTGDLKKAEEYLSMSEKLRKLVYGEQHFEYATAVHNLAAIQNMLGKYDVSDKNYRKAVNLYIDQINNVFPGLSESEKVKFYAKLQERFEIYNLYVLERREEKPELIADMYQFRQVTKGILLDASQKIKKEILNGNNPELISKYNKWRHLKEKLSQLYMQTKSEQEKSGKKPEEIVEQINQLEKYLSEHSKAFSNEKKSNNNHNISWRDVQNKLKSDEAAVEIIRVNMFDKKWLDSSFYAVLIITKETRNQPDLVLLDNGYYLEHYYINNYLNSIRFQIDDNYSYPIFWEAIEKKIAGKKTVYLSQDGIYNKINVATLLKPNGRYVIDDLNVIIVDKTSDILRANRQNRLHKLATLFGNPKYAMTKEELDAFTTIDAKYPILSQEEIENSVKEIQELPGTKKEIEEIARMLKNNNWKVKTYQGINADESNFKQINTTGVLHLATHGFFMPSPDTNKNKMLFGIDVEKPVMEPMMRSGLLFAGATNTLFSDAFKSIEMENGILTAYEASSLMFDDVDLLVLSACETGLGEIKNGEGVYGLQRAFQIAGVKNIIMSLWKVNDRTTRRLMTLFYSYLLKGNSISNSLRKAQLELKGIYDNPYFWGGFIVVGN